MRKFKVSQKLIEGINIIRNFRKWEISEVFRKEEVKKIQTYQLGEISTSTGIQTHPKVSIRKK